MIEFDRKEHWENVYLSKEQDEVSWYEPIPGTSLDFVRQLHLPVTAKMIDVGGGDSFFVDHLLDMGYQNITVLDISESAISRAKQRLGDQAKQVKWVVTDVTEFQASHSYDLWHDRATFHFLTKEKEIKAYLDAIAKYIRPNGFLVIGTFSEQGPEKCSGIEIKQYSERALADRLKDHFEKIRCISVDHHTPFDTIQNFLFCSFRKRADLN